MRRPNQTATNGGVNVAGDVHGDVITGYTIKQHEQKLREQRDAHLEIVENLRNTHSANIALEQQKVKTEQQKVKTLNEKLKNIEADYQDRIAELERHDDLLMQFGNQIDPARLSLARKAVRAGRDDLAKELFTELRDTVRKRREKAEAVAQVEAKNEAQFEYSLGEIAEEKIRWADAAVHYARAAELAPDWERLNKADQFAWRAGEYARALEFSDKAIAAAIDEFGEGSAKHGVALNNHALNLQNLGRYAEAEILYRQAIEIGKAHPGYAISLNNLAAVVHAQGRYAEAEDLLRQAIAIDKAAIGEAHPDYAIRLNNLAINLYYQERFEEAVTVMEAALDIREKTLPAEHPHIEESRQNLANIKHARDAAG